MKTTIDGVEILNATLVFDGKEEIGNLNIGALILKKEGREYLLDVTQTFWEFENSQTTIECKLEADKELFDECKYNLTRADLHQLDSAEIFVDEFQEEPESMTLNVRFPNRDGSGMTKAINLTLEA